MCAAGNHLAEAVCGGSVRMRRQGHCSGMASRRSVSSCPHPHPSRAHGPNCCCGAGKLLAVGHDNGTLSLFDMETVRSLFLIVRALRHSKVWAWSPTTNQGDLKPLPQASQQHSDCISCLHWARSFFLQPTLQAVPMLTRECAIWQATQWRS